MRKIFYEIGTTKKQKEDTTKRKMVLFCLSDLHGTCYEPRNRPIIECAWDQKPDLILASGDMLSGDREEGDAIAVALLSRLSDLAPVCFVNGNHEMCVERHQPERYQKFMDKDKFGDDVYPWGIDMTTDEGQAAFSYYTWNNGGGFVDENGDWALNSDKNVEALNFAIGLVNDGYTNSDPANETRYDLQDMFGAGKVAMMIGPNNIPTYLSDGGYDINYDVTTIPANEGCDSVAMGVCDRLEVFKDDSAEDQEARTAAISKFFDFFYDDERYADYMVFEGFLPTTQTAADLLAKDDDTFASWIDILQSCNFYPATKTEWADVKQGVIEVEQNALLGDDVQTLLDDLQADIAG